MNLHDLVDHVWPFRRPIVALGAAVCASAVLFRDYLTISKLRRELKALENVKKRESSPIVHPTAQEIIEFGTKYKAIETRERRSQERHCVPPSGHGCAGDPVLPIGCCTYVLLPSLLLLAVLFGAPGWILYVVIWANVFYFLYWNFQQRISWPMYKKLRDDLLLIQRDNDKHITAENKGEK